MKNLFTCLWLSCAALGLSAQTWVDTLYEIETIEDLPYGTALDVAGNERSLLLDISYPTNDSVRACGRPLLVMVHGGAFISGDKGAGGPRRIREEFAKRGYTTASVSYRLGQFPTHQMVNCNISAIEGVNWNCLNMADTSEWYRAYLRGVQDVNGAIRYLVNQADDYQIDPQHIFVVGESAGGFIAMGVGFMDEPSEVLQPLASEMPAVLPPNAIYEGPCVQGFGLDTSIAAMQLTRPDLGPYVGELNWPASQAYRIRGVGNFYGAVFNNLFSTLDDDPPALYLFHQPNDLIVPYTHSRVLAGYAYCATLFPFNCQYIINRPLVWGSAGIVAMLDEMAANGLSVPDYLFDPSTNTANCAQQLLTPSLQGHAIDNFGLRTTHMAAFFAEKITDCPLTAQTSPSASSADDVQLYPNPISGQGPVHLQGRFQAGDQLRLLDSQGRVIHRYTFQGSRDHWSSNLALESGIYLLFISRQSGVLSKTMVVLH